MVKFEVDTSNFKIKSMAVVSKVKKASVRGMSMAVLELMEDSLEKSPKCPRDTGALAASHSVFVDGKLVGTSKVVPSGNGEATPLLSGIPKISSKIEGALVVHKPYAASQHEGIRKGKAYGVYTLAGSGPKWIESKLIRFAGKYFGMIAGRIRAL